MKFSKKFSLKSPFLCFLNACNFHNYKRHSLNEIKEMIEWLSQNFLARELCLLSTYWSEVCRSGKYVNCESRFFDVTLWPQFQNLDENTIWNMIALARIDAKTSRDSLSFAFYWTILFRDQLEKFLQNYNQTRQSILNMNWIQLGLEGVKNFCQISGHTKRIIR